jgi:uncharacterized OB-fold protein
MCPACGGFDAEVFTADPRGRLLSWILPRHPQPAHPAQAIVALIELDCGARLVTNLRDVEDARTLEPDAPITVFVDVLDGVPLPQARLEATGGR